MIESLINLVVTTEQDIEAHRQDAYHPDHCKPGCCKGKPTVVVIGSSRGYVPLARRKADRNE